MTAWSSPRVAVFVSSTIGECVPERIAASNAIESINCEPVLFEVVGARPHPARVTYLQGLGRSQICVIIWKESYGYVDPALGISGIEDEFRIASERGLDILLYVKSSAPNRDPRLAALIKEARTSVTTWSYTDETTLQDQIKADITSLLGGAYLDRVTARASRLTDPLAVLNGTMPPGMPALERPELERLLDNSVQQHAVTWLTGSPGAGKTILLAQWSIRRKASYVNARGLSLRRLIHSMATATSTGSIVPESVSLEETTETLRSLWRQDARWPLAIDDPDPSLKMELVELLADLSKINGNARVVIGARDAPNTRSGHDIAIPTLTSAEATEIINRLPSSMRASVSASELSAGGVLPLAIRRAAAASTMREHTVFEEVDGVGPSPKVRELLAFIVASPEPLTLDDLTRLSSSDESVVVIDGYLSSVAFLLVDDGLGFRPVHDEIASDLRASLARHPALQKFVSLRLAQFFERSKRFLAAFQLYQEFDPTRALRPAYRAASQASIEGRFALAIPPLRFIVNAHRDAANAGPRADLAVALITLSQSLDIVGDASESNAAIAEAEQLANQLGDETLRQVVRDQKLIKRVRSELRPDDLNALREVRKRYKAEGRTADSARLAVEEGAIRILVADYDGSAEVSREALADFEALGDPYGVYVAARNLIASLNMIDGKEKEAEQLMQVLAKQRMGGNQQRERAWMCNILARRYRIDGRLDDAVAVAQEAIEIGRQLNDPYVVALNRIGLGNALREKGDLAAALESFKQSGKEAQAINRKEIDGLASRLAASVLVQQVDTAAPYLHPKLFNEAEIFATYVIGLLTGSIAEYQAAEAYECRGDARMGLGRKSEAFLDYAAAAKMFAVLDEDQAIRVVRTLAVNINISNPIESMKVMLAALPGVVVPANSGPWEMLLTLINESLMKAHPHAVGSYITVAMKIAQSITTEKLEVGLWLRLLSLALEDNKPPDDGRMAFVLSAFLAHTRQRALSLTQLTAMTELTIGQSDAIHFHTADGRLQTSLRLGPGDKILLVFDDIESTPDTRFLVTAFVSFFTAFRKEIDREFLASPIESGLLIRCMILDVEQAPADIKKVFAERTDSPVTVATIDARTEGVRDMIVACRADVQEHFQGDMLKATELQFTYATILSAVLEISLGGKIDLDMLRPKIVSLIRKTIQ